MWYIVLSHSLPDKEESKRIHYEEHRQWLDDQHRSGRLLFSGPTSDLSHGIGRVEIHCVDFRRRFAFILTLLPMGFLLTGTFMSLFGFFHIENAWTVMNWTRVLNNLLFVSSLSNT